MKKILITLSVFIVWFLIFIYILWNKINTQEINQSYVQVLGTSMNPTLENWKLYKTKEVLSVKELKRDDIVVFEIFWADMKYIKRLKMLPGDKYTISYEKDWKILVLNIEWGKILKFVDYEHTKFYEVLLLWSWNTKNWSVKAPQCGVFGDNIWSSIDSLEYGFIWCSKITHKLVY